MIRCVPFLAGLVSVASMQATAQAPSVVIPSRMTKIVVFEYEGARFRVDAETGRVEVEKGSQDEKPKPPAPGPTPAPTPKPDPEPRPPAPVVVEKPAFVVLFVAAYKADVAWLEDRTIRAAADSRGIQFRGFRSTEPEVDELGYRQLVRAATVPCVVIQSASGKVLLSRKVESPEDVIKAMDEAKR